MAEEHWDEILYRFEDDIVDKHGEIVGKYQPRKQKSTELWFKGFMQGIISLAQDQDLSRTAYRIFLYLMGNMSWQNEIFYPQSSICAALGLSQNMVSRSLKQLVDKKILIKWHKIGRSTSYKLNPEYAWKGTNKALQRFYAQMLERQSRPH